MKPRVQEVVIDCADPAGLARFWGTLLDTGWGSVDAGWATVDAGPMFIAFQRVPEPKQSPKNRVHLDLEVESLTEAVTQAVELGATRLAQPADEDGTHFVVMADPESNEFCFVADPDGTWTATQRSATASRRD